MASMGTILTFIMTDVLENEALLQLYEYCDLHEEDLTPVNGMCLNDFLLKNG